MDQFTIVKTLLAERTKVLAYIFAMVRHADLAEDIFQDVCMLALQKQDEIIDRDHLLAWMRVTARLRAKNVLRERRKEQLPLSDELMELLEARWRARDDLPSSSILDALESCMKLLTEKMRKLLQERYAEGISMEEIARRLNRPVNSVYVTLSRAHQSLGDCVYRRLSDARKGVV